MKGNVFGIDFGNDQGDVGIHAEGTGVVDDDAAALSRFRSQFFTDRAAGKESDIDSIEGFRLGFFNGVFLPIDHQLLTSRTVGCQQLQLAVREFSFFNQADKFLAYGTCGT